MEYLGCYNAVIEAVSEATEQFKQLYTLNHERYSGLLTICKKVDELFDNIECLCMDVSVYDVPVKRLSIEMECEDIILQDESQQAFLNAVQMFGSFSFSKTKNDNLRISLNIDDMWEKIYE